MVTCLAPTLGADCARIRLRATLSATGRIHTEWFGGDSSHPEVETWAREAVTFTYSAPAA
jgi:putative ATP-dependent endonuclease of OLD family